MSDMKHDVDALETQGWLAALESGVREEGVERAQYLLEQLLEKRVWMGCTCQQA